MMFVPLLMTVVLSTPPRSAAPQDKYLETIKVSENVYVFEPKIDWTHGNGVAIIGPEGVFFIDTYIQAEAIRRLKRLTNLPVKYVFNTHSHNDHTTGNGVFRRLFPHSRLIVQEEAVAGLETRVKQKVEGELEFPEAIVVGSDQEWDDRGRTLGCADGRCPRGLAWIRRHWLPSDA